MFEAFRIHRTLLLSFGMLMLGTGLQNTLISLRAHSEGFSSTIVGLIMAAFYVGYLISALFLGRYLRRVGHIRVFAALTALCSITILLHSVWINPWFWIAVRLITGVCISGLYICCESWLNSQSTNASRGTAMAAYITTLYIAYSIGQLFLYVATPSSFLLFTIASIFISLASIPLLLTKLNTPQLEKVSAAMSLKRLYKRSPLGTIAMLLGNISNGTIVALTPLYAATSGFSASIAGWMVIATNIGCVVLMSPCGKLSDKFDRRIVLCFMSGLCSLFSLASLMLPHTENILFAGLFLVGGLSLPMSSIAQAYINDWLHADEMIPAAGTIVLISGIGSVLGPLAAGPMMQFTTPNAFWVIIFIIHGFVCTFSIWRMTQRSTDTMHDKSIGFIPTGPNNTASKFTQRVYHDNAKSSEPESES